MDLLHSIEILCIQHLQNNYRDYLNFLTFMSSVGDPRNILSVYFPLWFHLSHAVGTKLIWVAVVGDWFNLIFKWVLFGHRPYWWVRETLIYPNHSHPHLEQFYMTCETGPGSPSGHAMSSACVWYVMVTSALNFTRTLSKGTQQGMQRFGILWSCLWTTFWLIQVSVCVSRVFIATHFPHQVVLGVLAGLLVAEGFERVSYIHRASLKVYIQTNVFLLTFAISLYLLLKMANVDLLWSVSKARKWCANPDWVHLDTTPFASLVRNSGAFFGLGMALNSRMFLQSCKGKNSGKISFRLLYISAALTALQLFEFIPIPTHSELLFYMLSFCKSAAGTLSVVALVPYCIHLLIAEEEKKSS